VSFSRSFDASGSGSADQTRRLTAVHEAKRRSTDARQVGVGTLACARCDAPVALAAGPHSPGQPLSCPFCAHHAPLREFLSLAAPARPARVVITLRARRGR
jgi:hypothetical protein